MFEINSTLNALCIMLRQHNIVFFRNNAVINLIIIAIIQTDFYNKMLLLNNEMSL